MNGAVNFRERNLEAAAAKRRVYRLIQSRDSACMRPVFTLVIVLTILVAVATALIAPSIDMPDGVMREHHVASHSSSGHGTSNLVDSGKAVRIETSQDDGASRSSEILHLNIDEHTQSFVVLRC
jgi:hypothetical protein